MQRIIYFKVLQMFRKTSSIYFICIPRLKQK